MVVRLGNLRRIPAYGNASGPAGGGIWRVYRGRHSAVRCVSYEGTCLPKKVSGSMEIIKLTSLINSIGTVRLLSFLNEAVETLGLPSSIKGNGIAPTVGNACYSLSCTNLYYTGCIDSPYSFAFSRIAKNCSTEAIHNSYCPPINNQ